MPKTTHKIVDGDFDLSQHEAAVLANVSAQTLIAWDKESNPPPRNSNGSYPAKRFGMWMMKHQTNKPGKGSVGNYPFAPVTILKMPDVAKLLRKQGAPESKDDADARRTSAQADKFERENQEAAAHLIPVEEIEPALSNMVSMVRNRLLKLPVALAPLVLGDTNLYSIQQKLHDGVYDALSEVSVSWKSGATDDVHQAD